MLTERCGHYGDGRPVHLEGHGIEVDVFFGVWADQVHPVVESRIQRRRLTRQPKRVCGVGASFTRNLWSNEPHIPL